MSEHRGPDRGNVCWNKAHYPQLDLPAEYDARLHNYDTGTPCEYYAMTEQASAVPASPLHSEPRFYETSPYTGGPRLVRSRKLYRTIVVDPPWAYSQKWSGGRELSSRFFKGGTDRGAACMYDVMDQASMLTLPVNEWAEDNAHLYLWTTNAFVLDAHALMTAWGFQYKTMLTWCKNQIGMGRYFRNTTEHVLFGVRGSLKCLRRDVLTHFNAPRGKHSEKPAAFYDMVESMSPGPYLDVFARRHRMGWDAFGNECFNEPELLETLDEQQRAGLVAKGGS